MPLTSHSSAITVVKWFSFESYFERQIINGQIDDILFLLSTGGGNLENKASLNLVYAANKAKEKIKNNISCRKRWGTKKISDICIHVKEMETSVFKKLTCLFFIVYIGLDKTIK